MLKTYLIVFLTSVVILRSALAADLVLVVGGSGGVGWHTVTEALIAGYDVRATTTNIKRAKERYGAEGFEWVEMDARILDEVRVAADGADYVISTLGGSCFDPGGPGSARYVDYQGVVNMAGVALAQGVKQFVLTSAVGAGIADQPLNQFCSNIQMWKWLGEDYIRDTALNYTIIRPGGLGNDKGGQVGIMMTGHRGTKNTDEVHFENFIQRADVARVLVEVLGKEAAMHKTIEITPDKKGGVNDWQNGFDSIPIDPRQIAPITGASVE